MGPIGVKKHLAPYLPSHPVVSTGSYFVHVKLMYAVKLQHWVEPAVDSLLRFPILRV